MKQSAAILITVVALSLGTGGVTFARGGGGGGGGAPAPHASSSGVANGNGSFSTDRDFGLDRATDRMNQEGLAHEKATANTTRRTFGNTQKPDLARGDVKK